MPLTNKLKSVFLANISTFSIIQIMCLLKAANIWKFFYGIVYLCTTELRMSDLSSQLITKFFRNFSHVNDVSFSRKYHCLKSNEVASNVLQKSPRDVNQMKVTHFYIMRDLPLSISIIDRFSFTIFTRYETLSKCHYRYQSSYQFS